MKSILFLCVANSARSQMAEGIAKRILHPGIQVQSAGSRPSVLNPIAVEVLAEMDIDIHRQTSKSVADIDLTTVDIVITLCAEEVCPVAPKEVRHLHWLFPDPTNKLLSREEQLKLFREVRDALGERIRELAKEI